MGIPKTMPFKKDRKSLNNALQKGWEPPKKALKKDRNSLNNALQKG